MKPAISMKAIAMLAVAIALVFGCAAPVSARPIRYTGFVISDVKIGQQVFKHARVYLSFDSDTSFVVPFTDGASSGFINRVGFAHLKVISGRRVIFADFAPHQIFVYYDVATSSVGFGSLAGGRGYPLSLTDNPNSQGLAENTSVGAVSDIVRNGNTAAYSPATATLVTDLTKPTTLSGGASSCVAFDPASSTCTNLTPVPLKTTAGPLSLFESYSEVEPLNSPNPYTINWGMFWVRFLN